MSAPEGLARALHDHSDEIGPVVPVELRSGRVVVLDFSAANRELAGIDVNDAAAFTDHVFTRIRDAGAEAGIGRYGEDRVVYRHSPLFDGARERRSVHLGIDLYLPAGTPVLAPLPATVHSFADNDRLGDYGPTVILAHEVGGLAFWTLYGHLDRAALECLQPGRGIDRGEEIGRIGSAAENGGWPPHLHLQIISDIDDRTGDYPGVAAPSERDEWTSRCPDPNLILRIPGL
jgi:murein DD-endopeptidase MepM/ murein hydrolase activator NlpD